MWISLARLTVIFAVAGWGACDQSEANAKLSVRQTTVSEQHVAKRVTLNRSADELNQPTQLVGFLGRSEQHWRKELRTAPIASVVKGKGGRSLGFRITFPSGLQAYFKPEQTFSGAHWYGEVGAYYLDRTLGLGRVLPVVGRRFPWSALQQVVGDDARREEVVLETKGTVRGALIKWAEEGLHRLRLAHGWEQNLRLEGVPRISPFQRAAIYRAQVQGKAKARVSGGVPSGLMPAGERLRELSDLILFDYLLSNYDRWGGDFTNVRTLGEAGPLLFFDNGDSFWPNPRPRLLEARLHYVQRFRRDTVRKLKRFRLDQLISALSQDELAPVLDTTLANGVATRVEAALAHIDAMEARFGQRIWLE